MKKYLTEKYLRFVGILILSIIVSFVMKEEHESGILHSTISFVVTLIIWEGCRFILFYFRKEYPHIHQTSKRLVLLSLVSLAYIIVINIVIKYSLSYIPGGEPCTLDNLMESFEISISAAINVVVIYESVFFFQQWKGAIVEKERMKHQQVRSQFAALKNQISPHFLFNSLNTLVTLIAENQDLAIDFTQKLSEVYRYILQNKEKEVVTLDREMQFAESYVFLQKKRFDKNLEVQFNIPSKYLNQHIAPLSLQMLIENAIKHNEVSTANPLLIEVFVENEEMLIVKNKLQRKRRVELSTQTGLKNIKQRYQLLSNKSVEVITTTSSFIVALPLLKISHDIVIPEEIL